MVTGMINNLQHMEEQNLPTTNLVDTQAKIEQQYEKMGRGEITLRQARILQFVLNESF